MPLLLDNIIFALQQTGGISVYWSELLRRLLTDGDIKLLERPEAANNIQRSSMAIPEELFVAERPALPLQLARYLPVNSAVPPQTIFHSSYYRVAHTPGIINIITVHDFTYEHFSDGIRRMVHSSQKRYAINSADLIICYSEHTRQDLLHFYPKTDPARIYVIPLAAGAEFKPVHPGVLRPACMEGLRGRRYMVYVGDRSPYKNFPVAVETISLTPEAFLVMVGGKDLSVDEQRLLNSKLAGRYRHLRGISTKELNLVYTDAWCLLYPSAYEGFGIPPLEAMQAGCPVIAVDTASLPEVCGEAALLATKPCIEEFIHLVRLLDNAEQRATLRDAGIRRAATFSWDITYAKTYACYQVAREYQRKQGSCCA